MIKNIIALLITTTFISTSKAAEEIFLHALMTKSPVEVSAIFGEKFDPREVEVNSLFPKSGWSVGVDGPDYDLVWTYYPEKKITYKNKPVFSLKAKFWKPIKDVDNKWPWSCYSAVFVMGSDRTGKKYHCPNGTCNPAFKCPHNASYVPKKVERSDTSSHGSCSSGVTRRRK